ncbi:MULTISPECIES: hypothetical protein [unclassified Brucella]|uniref:hypothetical protein n=1 Tax=unclassified Brucella TaxID=2632610 RepID=UPI0012AD5F96|nr:MULTISPECIES: hypothetical protein [unclassified Brucella]MRN43487.1 hypothetical protein [Brucella sp. 09RB8913]MRN58956.1 hypothetical protein [Brucella sp. 09RB8918]CAB4326882.1 hypothetical protein BCH_02249 [Brucella sp. 191011898]
MLRRIFREPDQSDEFYQEWAGNAQKLHSAVFDYIQSVVVLGALQFAVTREGTSWTIWAVYLAAYGVMLLATGVYFRAGVLLILRKLSLKGRWREVSLWISGLAGVAFNVWLVRALGELVQQIIAAGLSGNL